MGVPSLGVLARVGAALLVVSALLAPLAPVAATGEPTADRSTVPTGEPVGARPTATTAVDPDSVLLRATVSEDGDAAWLVEYRVRLDDENATTAFEAYAADVRENTSRYRDRFAARMGATVADAENATGRPMDLRNVTVTTRRESLPQEYGVVAYRFEWTGFAVPDGDEVSAGDAVSGLFLDRRTTFVLRGPPDHRATAVSPTPDDRGRAVTWTGPTSFGSEEPRVTFAPAEATSTATPSPTPSPVLSASPAPSATPTPTAAGGADGPAASGNTLGPMARLGSVGLAVVGLLALLGAGVVVLRGRSEQAATDDAGSTTGGGAAPTDGDVAAAVDPELMTNEEQVLAVLAAPTDGDVAAAVDPELMTNEEQVLAVLAERERIKQPDLAAALDWTPSKTSKVVTALREEGRVETFRVGRENVIELADETDI